MHNYGFAIDGNSDQMNYLQKSGILEKVGFHRPVGEAWHIEPKELSMAKRSEIRSGGAVEIGDPKIDSVLSEYGKLNARGRLTDAMNTVQVMDNLGKSIDRSMKNIPAPQVNVAQSTEGRKIDKNTIPVDPEKIMAVLYTMC